MRGNEENIAREKALEEKTNAAEEEEFAPLETAEEKEFDVPEVAEEKLVGVVEAAEETVGELLETKEDPPEDRLREDWLKHSSAHSPSVLKHPCC